MANPRSRSDETEVTVTTLLSGAAGQLTLARNLAEASSDAMLLSDGDGTVLFANAAAHNLFGGSEPSDLTGRALRELLADCPRTAPGDGSAHQWHTHVSMPGGTQLRLRLQLRALDPPRGSILALVASRDRDPFTLARAAEHDGWPMAVQGSMDGFWHLPDIDNDEAWWSPRMFQLLGHEPGDFAPGFSQIVTRIHPHDKKPYLAARRQQLKHGEPFDMQVRLRHASGEYRHFRMRGLLTRTGDRRCTALSGSMHDVTELQNALQAVRASQARISDMASAASDFFFELDDEFRVVWLSENFHSVTGLHAEDLIGRDVESRLAKGCDEREWKSYVDTLESHKPFRDLVIKRTNSDGSVVYTSRSGSPMFDAHGVFLGYRGSGTDVTARMEMENALRESEEKYRTIVAADQNAVLVVDAESMRIVDVNDAAVSLYAMDASALLASRPADVFADPDAAEELLESVQRTGSVTRHRDIHQQRSGSPFPVDISARCVNLSGRPHIVVVVQDMSDHERALTALRQSDARFKALVDNAPLEIFVKDMAGRYVVANSQVTDAWDSPAADIIGHTAYDLWDESVADAYLSEDQRVLASNTPLTLERWVKRAAGLRRMNRVKFPIPDESGQPIGIAAISYDTTERFRTLEALESSERRFRGFADLAADYLWETDANMVLTFVSERCLDVNGVPASDMLGKSVMDIYREYCHDEVVRERYFAALTARKPTQCEWTRERPDGSSVRVFINSKPMFDANNCFVGYRGITRDITESFQLSAQLAYQATHDSLTGLVNRGELENRLQRLLESAREDGSSHALCYLDLDQFKVVNDTCGHMAGDALLERLAETLTFRVRQRDTVARMGGDEFAVLIEHCTIDRAMRVVNNLQESLSDFVFTWKDKQFQVGASMGLVPITPDLGDVTEILSAADSACYVAKEQGRNRIHIYSADDSDLARRRGEMNWVSHISGALAEDRFRLRSQPMMALFPVEPGKRHCELLVNMIGRDGDVIPPGAFLPAAERYNLATRIDRWVVTRALTWLASGDNEDRPDVCGINLSAQSLSDKGFLDFIRGECARLEVPASQLCFEITETTAIANLDTAIRFMHALKSDGAHFALDDFGKGLSSFGYLRALPVDFIKIDAQFVRDLLSDPIDVAMVRSINDVARLMSKRTIAEGVESHATLTVLREIGVDFAQGFAIGEPAFID